jgi:hypothetical protein
LCICHERRRRREDALEWDAADRKVATTVLEKWKEETTGVRHTAILVALDALQKIGSVSVSEGEAITAGAQNGDKIAERVETPKS